MHGKDQLKKKKKQQLRTHRGNGDACGLVADFADLPAVEPEGRLALVTHRGNEVKSCGRLISTRIILSWKRLRHTRGNVVEVESGAVEGVRAAGHSQFAFMHL